MYHPYTIFPLGDKALTIDFGNVVDEAVNDKVLRLYRQMKRKNISYITDLVPAYSSLTLHYDLAALYQEKPRDKTAFETLAGLVGSLGWEEEENVMPERRILEIPVCYDPEFGPDIEMMASEKALLPDELVRLHTDRQYRIYMIGFLPGFAYMGRVNERISHPRRDQPRHLVAAGSVGIAGVQTGIYPLESPGGWNIIGRTPVRLFDPQKKEPVFFQAGDEIKFYSITRDEFENYQGWSA